MAPRNYRYQRCVHAPRTSVQNIKDNHVSRSSSARRLLRSSIPHAARKQKGREAAKVCIAACRLDLPVDTANSNTRQHPEPPQRVSAQPPSPARASDVGQLALGTAKPRHGRIDRAGFRSAPFYAVQLNIHWLQISPICREVSQESD